jgi:hypothetical protein
MIHISPHLTKESANDSVRETRFWEGKYGSRVEYTLIDSETKVELENYSTSHNKGCEADYKIEGY